MGSGRATISDVARAAGVAPSTASVVFSGKTAVSDATRQRVLDAASSLGYTGPDPRAASLRRGRSGIVGVVFEEHLRTAFLDPVKTALMDGLTDAVASLGAALLLLRDDQTVDADGVATEGGGATLGTAPLDAVVLVGCSGRLRESLQVIQSRGIPVVVIEGDAGPDVPQITLDNREAQRHAASHLRALGHERVAIVTLPLTSDAVGEPVDDAAMQGATIAVTRERWQGARDVYPDARAVSSTASSIDEGWRAGRALLAASPQPTAIIAQSDLLAAGVIRAAEAAGLRVPDDLSVTGFDGITVDGLAPFELTTLVQPAVEKGRAAGEAVARMLGGQSVASIRYTCVFREGNTTAAPRDAAR